MKDPVYINSTSIISGPGAQEMIDKKNDKKNLIEDVGVIKVDVDRWLEAQKFERKTWCFGRVMDNDRNDEHFRNFNEYRQLHFTLPENLNIIELGCGPFTNLRNILPQIYKHINSIDLLDPLINDYVKYVNFCSFKDGTLTLPVPIKYHVNLINSPIEEFTAKKKYQLVIMINVLEHCYDVQLILDKIVDMMDKDGIFVFHDKFLSKEDANTVLDWYYDVGHPLKFTYEFIENFLNQNFNTIYNKKYIDEHNNICIYKFLKKK